MMPGQRDDFRRLIVPPALAPASSGSTIVDSHITQGLPHLVPLDGPVALLLVVPTGLARRWVDAPATAVVTSSLAQVVAAHMGLEGPTPIFKVALPKASVRRPARWTQPPGAPARLVVLNAGRPAGAVPLVVGARAVVPEADPSSGPRFEVIVREWDLRAGSLRGPGDVGSRLGLSWRRVDRGASTFDGWRWP